jgi:hypothetical protein
MLRNMVRADRSGNVLITGATGFVGSNLVRALSQKGYSVTCLVRKTSNTQALHKESIRLVIGDIYDATSIREAGRSIIDVLSRTYRKFMGRGLGEFMTEMLLISPIDPPSQTYGVVEKSIAAPGRLKQYILLCALVLAGILPFANRAVYMDEPQFLHVARSAIEGNWSFPQSASWVFFGVRYESLVPQVHSPIVEYYLAVLMKTIGGFDEVPLRMLFAVFPLLAIWSFYKLAQRFTTDPLLVSCLFAVSPAFFVLSPALMMDIPMLAFLLAGVSLYLDGFEQGWRLWPASIFLILAVGTGYTALVPIGCLFLWAVTQKRPFRELLTIALAPAAICVWLTILRVRFGQSSFDYMANYYTSHITFYKNILPMFSFIGGVALCPWMYLALAEMNRKRIVAISSILAAFALTFFSSWSSIAYRVWFVFLASSGIGLLILFTVKATQPSTGKRSQGRGFLMLWAPAALVFFLTFAEMISARYILLAMPPLFLVVFARIRWSAAAYVVPATLILSVALACADYRFVNSYRNWVAQNIHALREQGFTIWNAAESGLRYYLEQEGIETLESSDLRPKGGDLIMRQESFDYGLAADLSPLLLRVFRMDLRDAYPIRTFSREAGAGFHDSHFGQVPFSISMAPLDRIEISEVSPFVIKLPQVVPADYSSVPVWSPNGVLLKQVDTEMKFPFRMPRNTKAEYELEGKASVHFSEEGIVLRKESRGPVLWKNFRIVSGLWP